MLIWAPQPGPQKALIDCPLAEVFYGGARGGGKTDGLLGKWALKEAVYGAAFNAIMFRRTTVAAEDAIERSKEIFGPLCGKYNEAKLRWRMPNGGRVSFAYLDSVNDAQEYQGRNVTDAWVEEAGQYPDSKPIDRLFGVLRSAHGVPVQMVLTANPGGPGQHWLSERYRLRPLPSRPTVFSRTLGNGKEHRYAVIPARLKDNAILLERDPGYVDRLHLVGSDALVRAWLDGDWSAVEGAFFDCWSMARHVIEPLALPGHLHRFRSMDWGSAKPFSVGWWAVASDPIITTSVTGAKVTLPRGSMIRYREWYGASGPNVGLKLTAEEVARGIAERQKADPKPEQIFGVIDPSAFAEDGGPSIAERMGPAASIYWTRADNKRVAQTGALGGWDQLRARLKGDADGNPMIVCFSTCRGSIRTIPVLQHDHDRPEDLDTEGEDHAADEWRYGCMARPWIKDAPVPEQKKASDYKPREIRGMAHPMLL